MFNHQRDFDTDYLNFEEGREEGVGKFVFVTKKKDVLDKAPLFSTSAQWE